MAKILYLDHAPIFGGAEVVLLNLLGALDRSRWSPLVATSDQPAFRAALDRAGVATISAPLGRLNQSGLLMPLHLAQAVAAVTRIVRERHIDLIHTNTVRAHIVGSLAAAVTRTPLIWTLHDNTFPRRLVRLLAGAPRHVMCVSQWLKDLYAPMGLGSKATVVYNGLDLTAPLNATANLRAELGVPPYAPLIVNVGRLVAGKAPHLFVQAARQVWRTHPDAYFVLVGGPDRAEPGQPPVTYPDYLARVVQECSLGDRLIMTGQRADVDRFYAAADALVYTSIQPEGLPTVLLEAMRYAVPSVATAIGGAAEIIEDSVTGWCVPPNDVDALAGALTQLLADRDQARLLGMNGRERLKRDFDLRQQAAETMRIYEQVLHKDYA
jgi:glycosyltransferase involved in cell wall biosynthesis